MITRWNIILVFKIQRIAKLNFNLGKQLYIFIRRDMFSIMFAQQIVACVRHVWAISRGVFAQTWRTHATISRVAQTCLMTYRCFHIQLYKSIASNLNYIPCHEVHTSSIWFNFIIMFATRFKFWMAFHTTIFRQEHVCLVPLKTSMQLSSPDVISHHYQHIFYSESFLQLS